MPELARPQWSAFFDALAPLLRASVVEVEASELGLGDRVGEWPRLAELSYDAGADVLALGVHGADRAIAQPREVRLRTHDGQLDSVEIVDRAGESVRLILREPLPLPPQ